MIDLELLSHLLYAVLLNQLNNTKADESKLQSKWFSAENVFIWYKGHQLKGSETRSATNLLELGDGVQELGVQLGVVLSQGLVAVVINELYHRAEGQRL